MSLYTNLIIAATKCSIEDAPLVERLMRDTYRTLDHLSKAAFTKEARLCYAALQSDPEFKSLMQAGELRMRRPA